MVPELSGAGEDAPTAHAPNAPGPDDHALPRRALPGLALRDRAQQAPAPPADRTAYAYARDSAFARPVNRGFIAFTIPQKDLFAENVAWSSRDSSFYVGSTRWGT